MPEEIKIEKSLSKSGKYEELIPRISALIESESDLIANLSNITAALKYGMDFLWVGFYFVKSPTPALLKGKGEKGTHSHGKEKGELVLGPFQGAVACTRISFGKGVCGTCWKEKSIIIVDDVEKFPGHISCNSESKSEIVLPVFDADRDVVMVLDIDSNKLSSFDKTDEKHLAKVVELIERKIK